MQCYIIHNGEVVPCDDTVRWAMWWEAANRNNLKHLALTEVAPNVVVSTIFIGIDMSFGRSKKPYLWETMVSSDYGWDYQRRYDSAESAMAGHEAMVAEIEERLGLRVLG